MKNGTPLQREAHFLQSKCTKHHIRGAIFAVPMSKKWQAAVARSTFASPDLEKNGTPLWREAPYAQNTACSGHFLNFRCRKIAHDCGAKHMSKSKCAKHLRFGTFLELPMWKRCQLVSQLASQSVSQLAN